MRSTFFGHFTAGATDEEISKVVKRMKNDGVTGGIYYSVEADLSDEKNSTKTVQLKDGHYHESERVWDTNLIAVIKSIDTAAGNRGCRIAFG
jgi:hypothetical protein